MLDLPIPLRGFLITGRIGTGKTTLIRRLAEVHGFTAPVVTTTRSLGKQDFRLRHLDKLSFLELARSHNIVLPMAAGGVYYGWTADEFDLLRSGTRVAASVRPYTALVLEYLLPGLCPIWLDVSEPERQRRVLQRWEARDSQPFSSAARARFDEEDATYFSLVKNHLPAEADTTLVLAQAYDHQ